MLLATRADCLAILPRRAETTAGTPVEPSTQHAATPVPLPSHPASVNGVAPLPAADVQEGWQEAAAEAAPADAEPASNRFTPGTKFTISA